MVSCDTNDNSMDLLEKATLVSVSFEILKTYRHN